MESRSWRSILVSPIGSRGQRTCLFPVFCCFCRCIRKELDQNWGGSKGFHCCRQWFNPLCHSASPCAPTSHPSAFQGMEEVSGGTWNLEVKSEPLVASEVNRCTMSTETFLVKTAWLDTILRSFAFTDLTTWGHVFIYLTEKKKEKGKGKEKEKAKKKEVFSSGSSSQTQEHGCPARWVTALDQVHRPSSASFQAC